MIRAALGGAAGVALVAVVVSVVLGYPLVGLGVALGLAVGVVNLIGMRHMAARVSAIGGPKGPAVSGTLRRLGLVTAVIFGLFLLDRQLGLGALVGMGAFQMVVVGCSSRMLIRALRGQAET